MSERLFGMEIEYGFAVRGNDSKRPPRDREWTECFMSIACDQFAHLPSLEGNGVFLQNGGRLYIDCAHPEMTTPECTNPWDIVRYMQAGERMLDSVASEMVRRERSLGEVILFKTNVDHSGNGATWGCHTSFLHRANPAKLPSQIIPHLVSRIVYTGGGGLELSFDGRLQFTLSPRVRFLRSEVSHESTNERGIFHAKDETLSCEGYHRLHIICGESLCSETAVWLSFGTTALIVAMIEAGLRPGDGVRLSKPLEAMRRFALDPTCTTAAQTITRKNQTAVQIQRHYLEMAEAHRHAAFMPLWADSVCMQWRAMLDRLEKGSPESVATMLDWAMKFSLFRHHAQRRGFGQDHWCQGSPMRRFRRRDGDLPGFEVEDKPSSQPEVSPEVLTIYHELCEIDTRFGRVGAKGIFTSLDKGGVLQHHIAGVDNIEHAMENGPAHGRARHRSECIKRFRDQNGRYACDWSYIVDHETTLVFDISDPFVTEEHWQPAPPEFFEPANHFSGHAHRILAQAGAYHERGDHETAAHFLETLEHRPTRFDPSVRSEYLRLRAWIQSRRGFVDGVAALDELAESHLMDLSLINSYVCAYRYQGMAPPPQIEVWIERGCRFLDPSPDPTDSATLPFLEHWGYFLLRSGRPQEAVRNLRDACQPIRRRSANRGAIARALADYGDTCRALGEFSNARALLDEAEALQIENGLEGDRADFVLTYRAKLESERSRALELIREANATQKRFGNVMGEARSNLLAARLLNDPLAAISLRDRLLELRGQRVALSQCPLLAKILSRWDDWVGGAANPCGGTDRFWWL